MSKIIKIVIFETCVLVALLALLLIFHPKEKLKASSVCFEELISVDPPLILSKKCFQVEVAKTPAEQERGLMFREHLDKDRGMLFIFEKEGNYPFWMKNTLIPLDMIWINQNKEVVFIKENAEPCHEFNCPTINPIKNAKYVLEINGGVAKDINLKSRDKIILEDIE